MIRLLVDYRKSGSWWKSGGRELWESAAVNAGMRPADKEIELEPSEAAQFLCEAAVIPGWDQEVVEVAVVQIQEGAPLL